MKKFVLIMAFCAGSMLCMGNKGCDKAAGTKEKADAVAGKITVVANGITVAVDAADPIVAAIEEKTGVTLKPDIIEKGADGAKVAADSLGLIGSILSIIPGGQAAGGTFKSLGLLAGGIWLFLENRKKRKAQGSLKTVIKATDSKDFSGVGKAINDEALKAGNADHIKAAFVEVRTDKSKAEAA